MEAEQQMKVWLQEGIFRVSYKEMSSTPCAPLPITRRKPGPTIAPGARNDEPAADPDHAAEAITLMLLDRYINAVLRHRWPVIVLAASIMIITGVGALFIGVTNDYRIMFSEENPQYADFKALENIFSTSNMAFIAIAPRGGSVFTREALGALEELTEAAWRTPHSRRVDSLTNYTHSWAKGDELIVEPLVDDARSLSNADLARIRKIALESRDLPGRLVSGRDMLPGW